METPKLQLSFKKILNRLKFGSEGNISADVLWQLILGGGVIGIAIIMTFAYLTYDWAMTIDLKTVSPQKARDTLSIAELEGVVAVYKNKAAEYERTLRNPPHAPEYRKGHGITVPSSAVSADTFSQDMASSSAR